MIALPPFLAYEPGTGYIRLDGHRIGLAHVVRLYADGHSADVIAAHFPTLSLSLVHKVLAFYLDNEAEVNAYVVADTAELRRQEAEFDRSGRQAPHWPNSSIGSGSCGRPGLEGDPMALAYVIDENLRGTLASALARVAVRHGSTSTSFGSATPIRSR